MYTSVNFNPGLALTGFRTSRHWLQEVNLAWARDPIEKQHLVSGQLKKTHDLSSKLEPAIWSRDTGQRFLDSGIKEGRYNSQGCMSLSTYLLEYDRHLGGLRRRRRAYAPTSNTASHDKHEKSKSWVFFSFPYGCGAPLGGLSGRRSSAINVGFTFWDNRLNLW